jgi:zinc transport system substrate-binding protein
MQLKRLSALILAIASALYLTACGAGQGSAGAGDRPIIAVSIPPERAFVEAVCGEGFEVVSVVPDGFSAETYEPTPGDLVSFQDAAVYFSIGVPSETASVFDAFSENTKIVALHEAARADYPDLLIDGERDPHLWLSVRRAIVMTQKIAETLSELFPENAAQFAENAENYIAELDAADKQIRQTIENAGVTAFLALHPAFGYFADEYGLTMYALEEHGKEPTVSHLMEMAQLAENLGLTTVFYQAQASESEAKAFAEEIGGSIEMLNPLSADYIPNLIAMAEAIAGQA